jgi:hypothetical protein
MHEWRRLYEWRRRALRVVDRSRYRSHKRTFQGKIDADGDLVVCTEHVVHIFLDKARLAGVLVAHHEDFEQMLLGITLRLPAHQLTTERVSPE